MAEKSLLFDKELPAQEVFLSPTFLKKYKNKNAKNRESGTIAQNRKCEKNEKTQKKRKSPQEINDFKTEENRKKSNPYSRLPLESYHKILENSEKFPNFQCFWSTSMKIPEELRKCNNF